jgi:hypothetical protein
MGSPVSLDHKQAPQPSKLFLDNLMVDPEVQRSVDHVWVRRELEKGFKPNALGAIVVSSRKNGTYHVIDGQHRVELCKEFGYAQPLDCLVYKGLSLSDEALMFLVLNNRRTVPPLDRFKVRVIQGDEAAIAINTALQDQGWKLQAAKSRGSFSAISSLEKVYTGWGRVPAKNIGSVQSVLSVIAAAWDRDPNGAHAAIVTGLGLVLIRHGNKVDLNKLVSEMALAGNPSALVGRARSLRDYSGGKIGDAMATQLINMLNKNKRGEKNRLPGWMETA